MEKRPYPDFSLLLVDDEQPWLNSMSRSLKSLGKFNNLILCSDSREVMSLLSERDIGLVLLDLTMPHISGQALLEQTKKEHPQVLVVIRSVMLKGSGPAELWPELLALACFAVAFIGAGAALFRKRLS